MIIYELWCYIGQDHMKAIQPKGYERDKALALYDMQLMNVTVKERFSPLRYYLKKVKGESDEGKASGA